ncbi:MAG: aminopeptidase [Clostridiales bacterium]|nr:aminopeptidase [Clostridiales bacterium]
MNNKIEKYAELLVRIGINIQKDQTLVIASPIECAEFARIVTVKAYEAGAREVVMRWLDEKSTKIRYQMASNEIFDEFPIWAKEYFNGYADIDAAFLSISASDPELMKDVDPKKMSRANKASSVALEHYRSRMMSNKNVWCVASIPTDAWAKKVFPGVSTEEAVDQLWDAIFKAVRVDTPDPVQSWKDHQSHLNNKLTFLNETAFKAVRYKNSIGTDVLVELPKNHVWFGGGDEAPQGHVFVANMPTEEVFTMPKHDGVNGKIVSSMPLNYNGNLIENFSFTFKDGLVVDFDAEKGREVLEELLATDEGAKRLGEVALVPFDSPISNQNILFYNTLFDENASCHFALGKAYPICVKGGDEMNKDELKAAGANDSLTHVDFMVGTEDLEIIGIKEDDTEVPIFLNGNFA